MVAAIGLLALFGLSMSCLMAFLAFSLKSAEAAVAASFPILGLLIFPSNVYASPLTMPEPLRSYATHQPVSEVADAVRVLLLGGPAASHVLQALAWSLGITSYSGHWQSSDIERPRRNRIPANPKNLLSQSGGEMNDSPVLKDKRSVISVRAARSERPSPAHLARKAPSSSSLAAARAGLRLSRARSQTPAAEPTSR